ncbi:hypothetical protein LTR36_008811 [Oleoguttula mirabilis]|uniref:Uncharacterized protein n=1 Tax=Oleoguttula mirabilis TaxID=1507867 RepID=A0AAV9J7K0_9PEZI|nr:hypothetical protein LTR36_008811 [Oleoguttula mirabilis]
MSVIGEVVGIVACVAGVISAYRDGGAIIQKIKVKRAAKRAPPPPRLLEESIDQAPEEIEREEKRGIQRFGKAFEDGDHIAVIALQQITIQLQGSLLVKLRVATLDDDAVTDLSSLVDAADIGRDRTIGALLELRQRLLQAAHIDELQSPSFGVPTRRISDSKVRQAPARELPSPTLLSIRSSQEPARTPVSPPLPSPASAPPKHHRTWTRDYAGSREASASEEDAASGADTPQNHSHRKRHSSLLGFFRHHRSHSGSGDQLPRAVAEGIRNTSSPPTGVPFRPPAPYDAREQHPGAQPQDPKFIYQEWEDDPAQIWGAKPQEQERRDTVASMSVPPEGPSSPASTMRSQSSVALSMRPASLARSNTSTPIPTPTSENDYLGFCKTAWKLQNGDRKAMQKCKEFNDGWSQSNVYYLACAHSKCAFAGHIALDTIWDKVWSVADQGMKFRWSFLAKSHVAQSKVRDHQYAYQCMFCVFQGEKSPVYFGTDTYLEHVQIHRSQPLGEVMLYKTKCIADHVAEDDEEFDINLFPLSSRDVGAGRRQSEVLSDELMGLDGQEPKTSTDAQDAIVGANEPWNAGLSDFHWSGELERAELE